MEAGKKINWYEVSYWGREKAYVLEAIESTWISGGQYIQRLEERLTELLQLPNAFAVANGTAALQLAFLTIDLQPGDEVLVPSFGFMAAANVLKLMHIKPVFVDVEDEFWCMDPKKIEENITERTKAIVLIHNYGVISYIEEVQKIAAAHNILIIEDCAEAIFSSYKNVYCGNFGDISTFSFHATKTVSTGEGGMVSTRHEEFVEKIKLIRSHGLKREKKHYWHEHYGNNFRMSNVLAAIGLAQIECIEKIIQAKKLILKEYQDRLAHVNGINFQSSFPDSNPLLWVVAIYLDPKILNTSRDKVIADLKERGIECRPGFYTPYQLEIYESERNNIRSYECANRLAENIIVLPSYPKLPSSDIDYISLALTELIS